jgi:Phosphoribosyl-ATP pyrophosphohydrolase
MNANMNPNTKSFFDMEMEFADACDLPKFPVEGFCGDVQLAACRTGWAQIDEEVNKELSVALAAYLRDPSLENKVEVADAIGDSIFVLCQLARYVGIPLNAVYKAITDANMTKVDATTGKVTKDIHGKVQKPEGFVSPQARIFDILLKAGAAEHLAAGTGGAENWTKPNA